MTRQAWGWFAVWMLLGAGWCLAILAVLSIGVFIAPVVLVFTVLVTRQPAARASLGGVVSGLGLPMLYVAYLNRHGPGMHCTSTPTSESCTNEYTPWPFLLTGAVLFVLGVMVLRRQRFLARSSASP